MKLRERKYSVLIVEDDPENLKFLKFLLSRQFYVTTCQSEKDFLLSLSQNKPDAILMDISLSSEKSGLKLIKVLREIPVYKDIPVICLSAHIAESDKFEALSAGANLYLRKPVNNSELINSILSEIEKSYS